MTATDFDLWKCQWKCQFENINKNVNLMKTSQPLIISTPTITTRKMTIFRDKIDLRMAVRGTCNFSPTSILWKFWEFIFNNSWQQMHLFTDVAFLVFKHRLTAALLKKKHITKVSYVNLSGSCFHDYLTMAASKFLVCIKDSMKAYFCYRHTLL